MSDDDSAPDLPPKQCTRCHEPFPATLEYFGPDKRASTGLKSACKQCVSTAEREANAIRSPDQKAATAASRKVYRLANKENIALRDAEYRQKNKEKIQERVANRSPVAREKKRMYAAAYYRANREKCLDYTKKWRIDHPEKARENGRKRAARSRAKHPEVTRKHNIRYAIKNPGSSRERCARRRARQARAAINDFTHAQWVEMQAAYDHRCVYCGKRAKGHLTQDHLTPLSKGGNHTASNLVPACGTCNAKKYNGPPGVPVQPLLVMLAKSRKAS